MHVHGLIVVSAEFIHVLQVGLEHDLLRLFVQVQAAAFVKVEVTAGGNVLHVEQRIAALALVARGCDLPCVADVLLAVVGVRHQALVVDGCSGVNVLGVVVPAHCLLVIDKHGVA